MTPSVQGEPQQIIAERVGGFEWEILPNVVAWTDELHRIYGIEPGQFEGTFEALLARIHPEDRELTRRVLFEAFRAQSAFDYDHRVVRPDGSVRTLHTRGEIVKDPQGNPIRMIGTSWDITDRAETAAARERSVSLLEATLEATADGILVVDRAGNVVLANERLQALWGLAPTRGDLGNGEAVLERMLAQVEDPDGFRAGVLALEGRATAESADIVRLADGRVFERHSRPQRIGTAVAGRVWTYRDVSERERLLGRALFLADATRLLASLDVERALDAVAHLAVPHIGDGCAIDLMHERELQRLVTVSLDPANPIAPHVHPSVLGGDGILYRVESTSYLGVPLAVKDEIVGAITLSAAPRREYGQADLQLALDLARRAALAVENARLYRAAQEAVRARDEFLSIAAHEIRGPVSSLHLAVQMLEGGRAQEQVQRNAFGIIQHQDHRLAQFVDELLDLSRIRAGALRFDLEDVDLGEIVRGVAARLDLEFARAGSRLRLEIEAPVRGRWDRFRLDQVVTNLLSNAIKFGLAKPIRVQVSARAGSGLLVVEDHGMGIAPELQERIFRPFERGVSVRNYGGLGLGLYIVKTLVEGMHGRVSVASTIGTGSTFTVELPRERPQ